MEFSKPRMSIGDGHHGIIKFSFGSQKILDQATSEVREDMEDPKIAAEVREDVLMLVLIKLLGVNPGVAPHVGGW